MNGRPAGDKAGSRGRQQVGQIERQLGVTIRAGGAARPARRGGPELTARHTVIEIVDAYDLDVHVAAGGVDEVVATDGRQIAIPTEDRNHEPGVGQFQAGGEGDGAAVGGVIGVEIHVAGHAAAAADPGNDDVVVSREAGLQDCLGEAAHHDADATARAPDVGHPVGANQIVQRMLIREYGRCHRWPPPGLHPRWVRGASWRPRRGRRPSPAGARDV